MPTLASLVTATSFSTTSTPKSPSAGINWAIGDYVVIMHVAAAASTTFTTAPTASGLSFSSVLDIGTSASDARITFWVSTAATSAGSNVTLTCAHTGSGTDWGFGMWVVTGSSGVGATAGIGGVANGATGTESLTTTASHSAVLFGANDWSAVATTGSSASPAGSAFDVSAQVAGQYTYYFGHLTDAGSPAAQSYGVTGVTGTKFTLAAIEMKAKPVGKGIQVRQAVLRAASI